MYRPLAVLLAALALACAAAPAVPEASPTQRAAALAADRIQILHTNDIHGRLDAETVGSGTSAFANGGMAALAAGVAAHRAKAPDRTLLVDAGDTWQGTFMSNVNKGEAVTKAMSLMRYDAMAVGNHDFDWGQDVLAQRAREASFPLLATNVVEKATGKLPSYLRPYVVKDLGIARVALVGVTNPASNTIVKATSVAGLQFGPAAPALRTYLAELEGKADVIVVVAHIGSGDAAQLARDVPGIDVLVAGHDHTPLQTARLEGRTTIVNTGAYTQYLGRLELVIDRSTRRLKDTVRSGVLGAVASSARATPDPQVAALVEARRAETEKYTARVVGTTAVALSNAREETAFGNLITDAFLEYGRQQGWKTDVAFYNMAGVRASFPAGELRYGQLYQALPFGNTVVSVDLAGADLAAIIERAVCVSGRLHMAGVRVAFRYDGGRTGCVRSIAIGGAALDPARVYHVATIDYLLLGGDGHGGFAKGTNVIYGDVEVDVVAAYIGAHTPVSPKVEGRLDQS